MTLNQQISESLRADLDEWLEFHGPAIFLVVGCAIGSLVALMGGFTR